jgi:hypothetical protein
MVRITARQSDIAALREEIEQLGGQLDALDALAGSLRAFVAEAD